MKKNTHLFTEFIWMNRTKFLKHYQDIANRDLLLKIWEFGSNEREKGFLRGRDWDL